MRHRKKGRKLHRKRSERLALMRGLASQIILHGRITTTEAKAKEMRPFVERLVTRAKAAGLSDRRELARHLGKSAVKKLVDEIAPRFQSRAGGYLRITKLGRRAGDSAEMALVEFV